MRTFRITLREGAGSDGPRVFTSLKAPVHAIDGSPPGPVLKFVTHPVGRVVRVPPEDVLSVEEINEGGTEPYEPEPEHTDEEDADGAEVDRN